MSVKTEESVLKDQEELQDDMSNEDVVTDDGIDESKMQALKAKLAEKKAEVEGEVMPAKIVEYKRRSLELGVVGSGQAGTRLAEAFYNLGYTAICFNTAPQDLEHIKVPEENKYLLEHGIGGAAKDIELGFEAAEKHKDGINQMVHEKLANAQVFLLCLSLGGGSGAGSCETMVDVLTATGRPVVVMTILPMSTDDAQTKNNALQTLSKLASLAQSKVISNLIVVDNAKIETIYNDVGTMDFFRISNQAIVDPLHVFNEFSSKASAVKSLDPMEFAKILTDGEGLTVYGEMTVADYHEDTAIAEAVINNLDSGLLASGFDLKQTRYAGALIIANEKVWSEIPSGSVNYAMSMIRDVCGHAEGVFRGIYTADLRDDVVKVYSIFSGLGLPAVRVKQLQKDAQTEAAKAKDRADARNLHLELDTGVEKTTSEADRIRQKIKKNSSDFSKNFGSGKSFRDLRKK
jgi:cell division GTPase FtsZ